MADIIASDEFERLIERAKTAWSIASQEHSSMREAYRWLWPERYYQMVGGQGQDVANRALYNHIFDPTGMHALHDGAAQIAEVLHPQGQEWARWVARPNLPEQEREGASAFADSLTREVQALFAESNFHIAAMAGHKDFLIGNGFLMLEIDPRNERRVLTTTVPAYLMAAEADAAGRWTGFFRKYEPRARNLEAMFGAAAKFSEETSKAIREEPEKKIEVQYAWTWAHEAREWVSCAWETKTKHKIVEGEHRTCPIIGYRPSHTAGRAWVTGPATQAVPDVRVANQVVELILKNAAIAVTGIWQAEDDGVLNPAAIRLAPGSIIPKGPNSAGLTPLEAPGRFDVSQLVLDDLRQNIKRALYATRIEEREMTAEEYRGRLKQQIREMRGMYAPLLEDFVAPAMARGFDMMVEMGRLPEAALDEILEVRMTGPLAYDAQEAEVERAIDAHGVIVGMVGEEMAMAAMNADEMVPWVVEQLHVDSKLFKTKAQIQEFGRQVQQLAAQALAQQMAGGGAVTDAG